MHKGRLEAFSDGVVAILITIMVLELHVPEHADLAALRPMLPTFASYLLSFVFIAIYWNNHHHLLQASHRVSGSVLWANMGLLFCLSLIPFVTAWMGDTHAAAVPVAAYGVVLLACAAAYTVLVQRLLAAHPGDTALRRAMDAHAKDRVSLLLYVLAIPLAFVATWVSCTIFVAVAVIWLVPDRRIERELHADAVRTGGKVG